MAITLTGYKAGPDNAYKGHPDGGTDTSSGVKLNEKYATCAIPMEKGRTNLQVGDVILVKNTGADGVTRKAVVWVTDVGGLPHGDIDLAKSPALEKQLGIQFLESQSGKSVVGLSGAGNVEVTRLASVSPKGLQNPDAINEAIVKVNERIGNKNDNEIAADFATEAKNPENIQLADAERQRVQTAGPSSGYRQRKQNADGTWAEPFRDEDQYIGYLNELMKTNPILAIFLMVIGVMSGMITMDQLSDVMRGMLTGEGPSAGYGNGVTNSVPGVDNARYNGRGVLGGRVQGLDQAEGRTLELPRFDPAVHKTAGEYFAACAKKFEGMREGPNNSGALVKWVMANAGLSEGQPWCAGFASKMYEGTGLYNYTAAAINFAEQGMATGSYRQGNIDGIAVGDTVVYTRTGGNHVGIVTAVGTNSNGEKVVTTVEGNSGQKVATHTRTLAEMKANNFLGYVDISHREEQLIAKGQLAKPIMATLAEKYAVGQTNQPEQTPPPSTAATPANPSQAPPGTAMASTTPEPTKKGLTIVLDRGHGALQPTLDTGAVSPSGSKGSINEIQVANIYQAELKKALEEKGYKVALTSDVINDHSKTYKSADEARYERTEIAKRAVGTDNGLYLSIHANSAGDDKKWQTQASGAEMFFAGHVAGSEEFARTVAQSVSQNGGMEVNKVKNYGRGSERNNGEGLRQFEKATFPSALIEMGYLNNQRDYDYLTNSENIRRQARAAAEGIDQYAKAKGLAQEQVVTKSQEEKDKQEADAKAKAEAEARAKAEAEARAKAEAEAKAKAEAEAKAKAEAEKAKQAAEKQKSKDQAGNMPDDVKAKALAAVSSISKENQVTDKKVAQADKNPAEMLAMHNATLAAVNKDKAQTPPSAKAAIEANKNTGAVLA